MFDSEWSIDIDELEDARAHQEVQRLRLKVTELEAEIASLKEQLNNKPKRNKKLKD